MEIPGNIEDVLRHKPKGIYSVSPQSTVFTAIKTMASKNVGSLLVMKGDKLVGLISERDYTRKVILSGKSSKDTTVGNIMTRDLITVTPMDSVTEALRRMTTSKVRHLPVLDGESVVGMISIGDLVKWVISAQDSTIHQLEGYIYGNYPG